MNISILISTYNGGKEIRPLLNSIQKLERGDNEIEVIVRDDASTDNTVSIIEQDYSWVQLIKDTQGNIGFVKSNNSIFQQSTGEVICCINQDTILHPLFIVEGLKTLQHDENVFGVNTNMIMPWVMSIKQYRLKNQEDMPAFEYQLTLYGFVRYIEVDKSEHQTNFMTGGGFFVRRSIFEKNEHLFDPEIDMYCEDTELSLRLQRLGGEIRYCPYAIIYHNQAPRRASTLSELIKLVRITRNRFALYARTISPTMFVLKYPMYVMGIIIKMSYLGLSRWKTLIAYAVGIGTAFLFLCLFPYWLVYSFMHPRT